MKKLNPHFFSSALTLMWLALGAASAQTDCFSPELSPSIQTTGGITYFRHTARVEVCNDIRISPVTVSGTNLSCTAAIVRSGDICICDIGVCCYSETGATVLGNLATGNYRLIVYGYPTFPWYSKMIDFQVLESSGSTLVVTAEADKTRIAVRGVPAAFYVLETSTNLLDWTSVRTNQGAPCAFTNLPTTGPAQFYRVQVKSGRIKANDFP